VWEQALRRDRHPHEFHAKKHREQTMKKLTQKFIPAITTGVT
jgi:hypothetical protein